MNEIQTYFSDTLSFTEGIVNMITASQFRPELKEITDAIKTFDAKTQATIDHHLRLGFNKFMMIEETSEGVKFFESNQESVTATKITRWKRTSRRLPSTFSQEYLYDVRVDSKTAEHMLYVSDAKASKLANLYKIAIKGILNERKGGIDPVTESPEVLSAPIKALNSLLWGMGIQLMYNKESSGRALQTYINTGVKQFRGDELYELKGKDLLSELIANNKNELLKVIKQIANVKTKGLEIVDEPITAKTKQVDIFEDHRKTLKGFSEISKLFSKPNTTAFVAATGKKIWPNNKFTFLGKHVLKLSTETAYFRDIVNMYMADPAFNPNGTKQLQSLTLKLLTDPQYGESIRANFERTKYDGYKGRFEAVAKSTYRTQDEYISLTVRLHHFINAGNTKYTRIAFPTQAGRLTVDFLQVPRLDTLKKNFNIEYTVDEAIAAIIIQDLARIAQAENFMLNNDESLWDEVAHKLGRYKTMSFSFLELPVDNNDENPSAYVDEYLESRGNTTDPTGNIAYVEKYVQDSTKEVKEYMQARTKEMLSFMTTGGITLKQLNPGYLNTLNIPNSVELVKKFVEQDIIYQSVEFVKLFANGVYNYKSIDDLYKRMNTTTTPMSQLSVEGTLPSDSTYGMPKKFTKMVINDVEVGLEIKDAISQMADFDSLVKQLEAQLGTNPLVTPAKIKAVRDSYKIGRDENNDPIVNKTDGTGMINMEFTRAIMRSETTWTDSHEEAMQNDIKTGKFVDNKGNSPILIPFKPFMRGAQLDNGRVAQYIGKNSFVSLTNQASQKSVVLTDVYNRMNALGPYKNLNKVQVTNTVSAEKGSRAGVHTLYAENGVYVPGQLGNIHTVTHSSDDLGIGQVIRSKKEEKVTSNRQFRKGLLSIIIPTETYTVNGYLTDTTKHMKLSGKNLRTLLQAVNVEVARRNLTKFANKIGLAKAINGKRQTTEDRLESLKKIRSALYPQISELNELYSTALDIVPSTTGGYGFKLPLSYPSTGYKLSQLFFSMFNKQVHKSKMRGVEAVQIAELGASERDGELKFLRVEEDESGNVRVAHAQVDIKKSLALKLGMDLEEGRFIIAYRVPNQGPSSTIILEIRNFLGEHEAKAIRVPGAITTQSGSDFDIDKLFVLFPELDSRGRKTVPSPKLLEDTNYELNVLKKEFRNKSSITDAMLSNLIIDLNTAVYANPVHLVEIIEPLDSGLKLVKDMLKEVEEILSTKDIQLAPTLEINNPLTPIYVEIMNKTGVINRGLKANALAGVQVGIESNITVADAYAPRVRVEGLKEPVLLNTVRQRDVTETQTTGRNISLGLNRAVDAEKTPDQLYKLGELPFNSTVTSFLQAFGVPEEESQLLLLMPAVRKVTKAFNRTGRGVDSLKPIVLKELKTYKTNVTEKTLEQDPIPLSAAEMKADLLPTKENKSKQGDYLITYYKHFIAADEYRKNNKAMTPDTVDRVSEPAGINAYLDSVDAILSDREDKIIFGAENVLEGDRYPLEKQFYENMKKAVDLSGYFGIVEFTASAQKLKQDIRQLLNYEALDVDQHRLIDRAVYTLLMSDPMSPFNWVYQKGYVQNLMMSDRNIAYRLEELAVKYPKLLNNTFFNRLKPHVNNMKPGNKVFPIVFDGMEDYNSEEREDIESDSYRLYFNPQEYAANAFLTSGFFKGPFSYFDLIAFPVQQAVSQPVIEDGEPLNITRFFEKKFIELASSPDAFAEMAHEIITAIGKFKAGPTKALVPSINVKEKQISSGVLEINAYSGLYSDTLGYPRYILAKVKTSSGSEQLLMRLRGFNTKKSAVYDLAHTKSIQFQLLELGIREDLTNDLTSRSLVNEGGAIERPSTENIVNRKKIKVVSQDLDPRKICVKLK